MDDTRKRMRIEMDMDKTCLMDKNDIDTDPDHVNVVSVESPYSTSNGHTLRTNIAYATACVKDAALRGESPFASHLLLTRTLMSDGSSDFISDEVAELWGASRDVCIALTHASRLRCDAIVLYTDIGLSSGMKAAVEAVDTFNKESKYRKIQVIYRTLPKDMMDLVRKGFSLTKDSA